MRTWGIVVAAAGALIAISGCKDQDQQAPGMMWPSGPYAATYSGYDGKVRCEGVEELKKEVEELKSTLDRIALAPEEVGTPEPKELSKKLEELSKALEDAPGIGGGADEGLEKPERKRLMKDVEELSKAIDELKKEIE